MPPRTKRSTTPARHEPSNIERLESKIRDLQDELFITRHHLLHLMDPQDLLDGYFGVDDFDKLREWREDRAKAIIDKAWVRPGDEMGDPRWPRALCPLCGQGAQSTRDVKGYAVPDGLRRHLLGELNSRQCLVFNAAESIARTHILEVRDGRPRVQFD